MRYKPYLSKEFKHEIGLKTLELKEWIEVDDHWQEQVELKRNLILNQREKVFQALPSALEASKELKVLLLDHLKQYHPSIPTPETSNEHPMIEMATWVQEDFCLMSSTGSEARLEAGCVCFPSRWKLIEKVGKNMAGIHQPVPGFNQKLEKPSTRFLLNTTADKPTWRLNWSLHASDGMFAYPGEIHEDFDAKKDVLKQTYLRVERQCLRRLPQSGYIVFSIRTYVESLDLALESEEERKTLASNLKTMSPEVLKYKGLESLLPHLLAAL